MVSRIRILILLVVTLVGIYSLASQGQTAGIRAAMAPTIRSIDDYGAKGDVRTATASGIAEGSKAITVANYVANPSDVGKTILIDRSSIGSGFVSTIAVSAPGQMVLSDPCIFTQGSAAITYGTDDTAAINQAIDALASYETLVIPGRRYLTTGQVNFDPPNDCGLDMTGQIVYLGTGTCLLIGKPTSFAQRYHIKGLNLFVPKNGYDSTQHTTGMKLTNVYWFDLQVSLVSNFERGLVFTGSNDQGCSYANIHLGEIAGNKTGLLVTRDDSSGWANELNFYGGSWKMFGSMPAANYAGTTHIQVDPGPDNDRFFGPSLEASGGANGNTSAGSVASACIAFFWPRMEGSLDPLRFTSSASNCMVVGGYGQTVVDEAPATAHNIVWDHTSRTILDGSGPPEGKVAATTGNFYSDINAGGAPYYKVIGTDKLGWARVSLDGGANTLSANQASVETDTSGWVSNSNARFTKESAQRLHGSYSLGVTASNAATVEFATVGGTKSVPCQPSTLLQFLYSARAKTAGRTTRIKAFFYDANGGSLQGAQSPGITTSTTAWTQESFTTLSPPTAAYVLFVLQVLSPLANETTYFDQFSIATGASTTWALPK